ncbi:MAG: type II toxin-antitoxin system Phd/YefM family antitoxin [Candidatus Saccharimonadales bacterium]
MTTANVHEAKTNLSKLLNAAAEGDEVIITRRGGKVTKFKLMPVETAKKPKLFGALKGKIIFAPDYDKADKEILDIFEKSIEQ